MYSMTEYALQMLKGQSFTSPVNLLEDLWAEVLNYGKLITGNKKLRKTFALNALVGVDNALWLLFAEENGITTFDEMIPDFYKPVLTTRNAHVAGIPLIAYDTPIHEIMKMAEEGNFFLKIKLGHPGTQKEMLDKDKKRITEIHHAIGHFQTKYSANGKISYYFDVNGRYENKVSLLRLLDHTQQIGAFDQIALIEEPFPEQLEVDVHDVPVRLAADESAHTDKETLERIQMGYKAIALKAIAKTFSMTLKIAATAREHNIPCFCADLTVNPILVDWNKNIAARLEPFPGMEIGLLETNGHQNYKNWKIMESYHPFETASWRKIQNGIFSLDKNFFSGSGGIFTQPEHYLKKVLI